MERDAAVIAAINAAVAESARWGFWKCFDRIHNQGYPWNHKRVYRVYCAMKLNLPRRAKRRVLNRVRQPLWVVPEMNVVWALDFMRDTLYGGKVREVVLSVYLFESLDQVRDITADWIEQYNETRPHDALGSLPPAGYRKRLLAAEIPV